MSFLLKINDIDQSKYKFSLAIDHLIDRGTFEDLHSALKIFNINTTKWDNNTWKMRKCHVERIVKTYHVNGLYIYTNERISIIQKGKETVVV